MGLELDPDNRELMYRQGLAAGDQVDTLLAEAEGRPDDFELRLRIDHALASKKQYARVVGMWIRSSRRILQTHDLGTNAVGPNGARIRSKTH